MNKIEKLSKPFYPFKDHFKKDTNLIKLKKNNVDKERSR